MTRRTVSVGTVGCRLNQYESDRIAHSFAQAGFKVVRFGEVSDVCVVNTCTVTGRSDYRSRQMVRRVRKTHPGALVVVTGCYAQNAPEAVAAIPGVSLVVGNAGKMQIPDVLAQEGDRPRMVLGPLPARFDDPPAAVGRWGGRTRAFLKIQDGCDGACAYCAVRAARGPSRSRTPETVLAEAGAALSQGHREIVLTGVNLGRYGLDGDGGSDLADILERVADLPGIARVRLSSVEPQEMNDRLAGLLTSHPRVCPHVHLPLQSGSGRLLRSMNRTYGPEDYARIVTWMRERNPDCGVGADVMVGFPGETDEDFRSTLDLVDALSLSYLHVFSYSPRPGTPAEKMGPQVPGEEKKARSCALRAKGRELARRFRSRFAGRTLDVLFEAEGKGGTVSGLTGNYLRVAVPGSRSRVNELARVRIVGTSGEDLEGVDAPQDPGGPAP
jgi:threonylcarbamoyladenosine tRNA methylthiotransferase MtaB